MIFNLFKSKPTLRELIPKGFVDIHSHILPGIDDGAKNVEESLKLISEMKKFGYKKIIGTPHTYPGLFNNTNQSIKKSFILLNNISDGVIKFNYASEYLIHENLIEKIKKNLILCLNENYVLVEMSFIGKPINLNELIFQIISRGYIPVLAHPERYKFLYGNFKEYHNLKKMGCKFQINMFSLIGYYGNDVVITSKKLIQNNMIDFIASDIHRIEQLDLFNKKILIGYDSLERIFNNTITTFN